MTLTHTQKYHLARFLSERYSVSLETAIDRIKDPEVEKWEDYDFVESRLHFDHKEVQGEFDDEYLAREEYFLELIKAYLQNTPATVTNYLSLIQITPEKETELSFSETNRWHTEEQFEEVQNQLDNALEWLEENVELNDLPESFTPVYRFNLAMLRYGLETMGASRVDFLNPYHTFRSKPHTNGAVEDDEDFYMSSLHSRLEQVFNVDELDTFDEKAELVVDELLPYYTGSTRDLVRITEQILETDSE